MDEADLAQEREEVIRKAALAARQQRLTSPDGKCIWCKDEPVVANTAFCSAECDEDYHKHQREIRQRAGRD
ncbi:UNVERIFIED_ORG: putative nucleic acid-binding Zn ribbon protein [Pantoea agglomerans]